MNPFILIPFPSCSRSLLDPWSGQTKEYKIGICCFSAKHTALRSRKIRLVCPESRYVVGLESGCVPSGVTCLCVDCCLISVRALCKSHSAC